MFDSRDTKRERLEMIWTTIGFIIILVVICGGLLIGFAQFSEYIRSIEPVPAAAYSEEPLALPEINWVAVAKIAGVITVLVLLYKFFQTEPGKIIGMILIIVAIVMGVGYTLLYGDKNGDGKGDSSIIAMVQMDGDNVERDSAYATINETNGGTNLKSTASVMGLFLVFLFGCLVFSLMYVVFKRI